MSDIKKLVLALAIAIVLNLFVNYGISVFYKAPQYNEFCGEQVRYAPYPKPYPAEAALQNCSAVPVSEEMQGKCAQQKGYIAYKYNLTTACPTDAYCETCSARFDEASQKRNSNTFIFLIVFGVTAIIAGMAVKEESVANGFLIGGTISLIIAAIRNWGQLQDVVKFAILGAVLALLIWVGYRKGKLPLPWRK